MGQEIKYNPEDWDFQEEDGLEVLQSDISLPNDFFKGHHDLRDDELQEESFSDANSGVTAFLNGEKISIGHHNTDRLPENQEELAFRRQIEDLFELLELEKEADRSNGIRVYQTDSSPSRPWRFH